MPQSKKILISGGNGNLAKLIAQNQPFNNFVLLVRDNAKIDLSLNNVVWLVYDDFFKNKDISFHSHSTTIKTRTFNIDILLLSIPKVILFPCCHKHSPIQLSFFANYIFHILV